ncbi:MAG: antibiotic biosynthesis monooxygenase [Chloroflexota bacterium]
MSILVTMQVGPVDWDKFRAAAKWLNTLPSPGLLSTRAWQAEDDPNTVLVEQEWESHQAFHAVADRFGAEFNRRAGTAELNWVDRVWKPASID